MIGSLESCSKCAFDVLLEVYGGVNILIMNRLDSRHETKIAFFLKRCPTAEAIRRLPPQWLRHAGAECEKRRRMCCLNGKTLDWFVAYMSLVEAPCRPKEFAVKLLYRHHESKIAW